MGTTIYPGPTNKQRDFTSSGTWTCPAGVYSARFLVVGAGGGGGGAVVAVGNWGCGGGGGGGAVKEIDLSVTPGTSYTITIGAKGAGGAGTAGGNGGFSEVLNGATSLIKCYGGAGGSGIATSTVVNSTVTQTLAGGGGGARSGANDRWGGGGGGANPVVVGVSTNAGTVNTSGEGAPGRNFADTGANSAITSTGGMGYNGYGAGGGGGGNYTGPLIVSAQGGSALAGNGATRTTAGVTNGTSAVANSGCGGGGSTAFNNVTSTTGGNGADGLVRVVYFA